MDKVGVFPVIYLGLGSMKWWASPVAQMVKRLPTMRETGVQSLGGEDLLEKAMARKMKTGCEKERSDFLPSSFWEEKV